MIYYFSNNNRIEINGDRDLDMFIYYYKTNHINILYIYLLDYPTISNKYESE